MNEDFIEWLKEQIYKSKIYRRDKDKIYFYWTDEKYDDSVNWDWDEVKEVCWSRNRYESRI